MRLLRIRAQVRTLRLTEYTAEVAVALTAEERDALKIMVPSMTIAPSPGSRDHYDLTPSSTVGVLRIGDLQIEIAPRLPVEQVLFLVSYALDPRAWRPETTSTASDNHLVEAIIPAFVRHVRHAFRRGLFHGYRTTDEALTTIRGRIRFADQLRARPGLALPVELQYDDFTADVLENRLLRAAIERLLRLPLRHERSRRDLRELHSSLLTVTPAFYRAGRVPEPTWTRLNARYRPAVDLARLILDNSSLNLTFGSTTATSVLFNMATVFEAFVVVALREALEATPRTFPQGAHAVVGCALTTRATSHSNQISRGGRTIDASSSATASTSAPRSRGSPTRTSISYWPTPLRLISLTVCSSMPPVSTQRGLTLSAMPEGASMSRL